MSKIDKMMIMGIRSFGPNDQDRQFIEFYTPLTLILGANGTGKTTIIECLKYVTTGEFPPGAAKGGAFVHDPKIARETSVRGQVRLVFHDVTNAACCVTRSLSVTQKAKSQSMQTLESVISRKDKHGELKSLSSKCGDMNSEMVSSLGVSKAVLENVIFCHQDESNWPLGEGKSVKMRFDDIFASTRYVKALESIKKLKKDQAIEIKVNQNNLLHLKKHKERASDLSRDLGEVKDRNESALDSLKVIRTRILPVEEQIIDIESRSQDIYKLQAQIDRNGSEQKEMERTRDAMLVTLDREFQGSNEDLQQEYRNFQRKIKEQKESLRGHEVTVDNLDSEMNKVNKKRSALLTEQGQLQHEQTLQLANIDKRNKLIKSSADYYSFTGFSQVEEDGTEKFMALLRCKKETYMEETRGSRALFDQRESENQRDIDKYRESKTKLEQTQIMKTKQISEHKDEIRKLSNELQRVEASADRLDNLNRDLNLKAHELETAEGEMDLDQLKAEVKTLVTDRIELDRKVKDLDAELNRLHQESTVRTQLDMLRKEKANKEDQIKRIKNRHEETFTHLFNEIPTSGFRNLVDDYVQHISCNIKNETAKAQKAKMKMSQMETQCKMFRDQLKVKEEELKNYDDQLFDLCGSQNFDEGVTNVQEKMQKLQEELNPLSGTRFILEKYINQLKKSDPVCPVCRREFDERNEVDELIQEMQRNAVSIPMKVEEKNKDLTTCQQKYEKMVQMKPRLAARENLAEKEIPDLRERVNGLSKDVDILRVEISTIDDDIKLMQSDESLSRNVQPDAVMIDKYLAEIRLLDKDITKQEARISGGDTGRSIETVRSEKDDKQIRLDQVSQQIEYKRERICRHTERLHDLKAAVNDLTAEKLHIENDLQKRVQMTENKAQLSEQCLTLQNEVQDAQEQCRPLEAKIEQLRSIRAEIAREKDIAMEEAKKKIEKLKENGSAISNIHKEIMQYIKNQRDESLRSCQKRLQDIDQSASRIKNEQDDVTRSIERLKEDIANQATRERFLDDNIKLREKRVAISALSRKIEELKRQLGDYDVSNLERQRRELTKKLEDFTREKHTVEGRQRGLMDEIKRLERDLNSEDYKDAENRYQEELINVKTMEIANMDLEKYWQALDWAVMRYHTMKMSEINGMIRELWRNTYRGNDIDTIEIRSDEEEGAASAGKARRLYHYRVVMLKGDVAIDMRSRCSAGQKVLASLIIRLALAETFCHKCGILALDEPTTNLDRENIESLAYALLEIIKGRASQNNFQLMVITHDEDFVELLGSSNLVDHFWKINRSFDGKSMTKKESISNVRK